LRRTWRIARFAAAGVDFGADFPAKDEQHAAQVYDELPRFRFRAPSYDWQWDTFRRASSMSGTGVRATSTLLRYNARRIIVLLCGGAVTVHGCVDYTIPLRNAQTVVATSKITDPADGTLDIADAVTCTCWRTILFDVNVVDTVACAADGNPCGAFGEWPSAAYAVQHRGLGGPEVTHAADFELNLDFDADNDGDVDLADLAVAQVSYPSAAK
jgi:hypothetical protein